MSNPQDPTAREKILAKLSKLIALSGSSNEHEANAALEKAMQIAIENNIELSQLSFEEKKKQSKIIREDVGNGDSRLPITFPYVSAIIKRYFGVDVITSGNRATGRKIWFFGKKDDIDFAKYLNSYLSNTMMNLWHGYYRNNPTKKASRESFILGVWQGLNKKLKENKERMEAAIAESVKHSYQLMLVDDKTAIQDAIVAAFPKLKDGKTKTVQNVDYSALIAGHEQGAKINVHSGLNGSTTMAQLRS